jgi:hypothetical protein
VSRQFRVTRVSDLLIRKEHVPTPTFSGMTEICDDEEGDQLCDQHGRRALRGAWIGNGMWTYLLIVSESPITQRCRFGRVIATASFISPSHTLAAASSCVDIAASR